MFAYARNTNKSMGRDDAFRTQKEQSRVYVEKREIIVVFLFLVLNTKDATTHCLTSELSERLTKCGKVYGRPDALSTGFEGTIRYKR